MFAIDDTLVPLKAENDGARSYYKVVAVDGDFVDVTNLNFMGKAVPRRRLASDFVTRARWDEMKREKAEAAAETPSPSI